MNHPYQRVNHDSTWNGIAIGAGAGAGMVGATHGFLAAKDGISNYMYNNALKKAGAIPMGPSGPVNGSMKRALRGKMFGGKFGWRGAAMYAGAGLLGGAIGGFSDYMSD